jgi:hypothetical protein
VFHRLFTRGLNRCEDGTIADNGDDLRMQGAKRRGRGGRPPIELCVNDEGYPILPEDCEDNRPGAEDLKDLIRVFVTAHYRKFTDVFFIQSLPIHRPRSQSK